MLKIGGLQKVTLLDYPGKVAATIFTQGCNFRCGFCHNPELVEISAAAPSFTEEEVLAYLAKRKGVLEGVCFTGGEPLLYKNDLLPFLTRIKQLGYAIKMDTNGTDPDLLQEMIEKGLIDYIAMDIKTSLDEYNKVTGVSADTNKIQESIALIMKSGLNYEFRTTVMPKFHSLETIAKIAKLIKEADNYYLQNFRNNKTLNKDFQYEVGLTDEELEKMKTLALKYVKNCQIRK